MKATQLSWDEAMFTSVSSFNNSLYFTVLHPVAGFLGEDAVPFLSDPDNSPGSQVFLVIVFISWYAMRVESRWILFLFTFYIHPFYK